MTTEDATSAHGGRQPRRYEIWVRGHLGETMRSAFPGLRAQPRGADTVLTGALPDQAALHGVLAEIEALGLELLEVRRCRPLDELPSADENPPDCTRRLHPDEQETLYADGGRRLTRAEATTLMISMRALECLVAIAEQGSLTKAAVVLHMSQPALSHQIAAIERELATPVIERLPRGIRPTAAGLAAAAEARLALAAADRALIAGRRVAAGAGGRIRIACAETMTAWVLVPVLRTWRRRFPDVELDLTEYTSADRMLDVLLAGGVDLTVGPRPTRTDEHTEVLGREEIVVVASAEHRFADLDAVPLAELAAEPLVHYNPGNGFAVWVDQFAAQRGVVLPQPALRTGFPRTAAQLAAAGMGVTIVPFSALTPLPGATIRSLDPPELRDVIVIVAAPHDDLLRRFVGDLKRRGLPESCPPHLSQLGPPSGLACTTVMPGYADPVPGPVRSATRPPRRDPQPGDRRRPAIRAARRC